jgi:hypothetical protein
VLEQAARRQTKALLQFDHIVARGRNTACRPSFVLFNQTNEAVMTARRLQCGVFVAALLLSGSAFAWMADPTPPNANTMGNPPSFGDTPVLGVPIEGRAAAERLVDTPPYFFDRTRPNARLSRPDQWEN